MKLVNRDDLVQNVLPGRIIQNCVGKEAFSASEKMTMGFARYCAEAGVMEPHHHAEEIVYIISSDRAWVRCGSAEQNMAEAIPLEVGMTLHFPELEWHVFEYEEGGHLEIMFFYGQTENIRPEEILESR